MNPIKNKTNISVFLIWIGFIILYFFYRMWGHVLISDIYLEQSLPIINDLLSGRSDHSVEYYFAKADLLINSAIISISLIFFSILLYTKYKNSIQLFFQKSKIYQWSTQHPEILVFVALLLFSIMIRMPYFFISVIDWDESTFILMGQSILDGNLPYIDLWDNKPPLAFAPYALFIWLFDSIVSVRVGGAIFLAIAAYFTYLICTYIWNRSAGLFAAVLSIVFVSIIPTAQATMSEIIVSVPLLGALALLVSRNINIWTVFFTGFLMSIAALIRLNLAYLVVTIGIFLLIHSIAAQPRSPIKTLFSYSLGGLIPVSIITAFYAAEGQLETLFKSAIIVPLRYSGSQLSSIESVVFHLKSGFNFSNALLWIGLIGGCIFITKNWKTYTQTRRQQIQIISVFFVGLTLSIINNGAGFYHHLIQIIAVLSIPAGVFYSVFVSQGNNSRSKTFIFIILLTLSCQTVISAYTKQIPKIIHNKPLLTDAGYQLAEYLFKENPSKEPMMLLNYHIAHWLTDTKPLSKYITHPDNISRPYILKVMVDDQATLTTELEKLLSKKPLFIVKKKHINYIRNDPNASLLLDKTLSSNYTLSKVIGKVNIYKRKLAYSAEK